MTLLDAIAHQPRLPAQLLLRLNDRVAAVLRHDRAVAVRPILGRVAAAVIGVTTGIALYVSLTILFPGVFPGLAATARVCVGTFPA